MLIAVVKELEELHSALEEAKADIVGLWALRFLIKQVTQFFIILFISYTLFFLPFHIAAPESHESFFLVISMPFLFIYKQTISRGICRASNGFFFCAN